jgi:predicted metal-binding membrane protein
MQLRLITFKPVQVALVTLTAAAWLSLFALEQSPYGQVMGHAAAHNSSVGSATAQNNGLWAPVFFTAGWALMVVARMLPTVLPMLLQFSRSIGQMGGPPLSVFLLLGGYVLAWTGFGVAAHLAFQAVVLPSGSAWMLGSAALVLAGAYQVSPLKRRALHRSCSPPALDSLQGNPRRLWSRILLLGAQEGATCISCCWALMLLMVVGVAGGAIGMLALGVMMYAEKNTLSGRKLVVPAGLFLIELGLTLGLGSLLGVFSGHIHSL